MKFEIHIHHHSTHEIEELLALTVKKLEVLLATTAEALQALTDQVTETDGVIDSAIVLIQGIPALIAAAGVDPVKLLDLQTQLKAKADALAQAIAAVPPPA